MNEIFETIKEYLDKLPPKIKKEIVSLDWTKKITELGQKYSLNQNQISSLEYETLFIMIGMELEEEFSKNIADELSISDILSNQLSSEIKERIFKPIIKKFENDIDNQKNIIPREVQKTENEDVFSITLDNFPSDNKNTIPTNLPTAEEGDNNWFDKLIKPQEKQDVTQRTNTVVNQSPVNTQIETKKTNQNSAQENKDTFLPNLQKPKMASFGSFVDHKLNSPTQSTNEKIVLGNSIKQNQNDPYREPIN